MSIVRLSYSNERSNTKPMMNALRLSEELREEFGLVFEVDYKWHFSTKENELHLIFYSERAEHVASIISMKYMGRNLSEI